ALLLSAPPAAAHVVAPGSIRMPVGGESYILVQDLTSCPADITATSLDPAFVQVCALDMAAADGSLLPGCNGTSVTVPNQVLQVFQVISIVDVVAPTVFNVRICWKGVGTNPSGVPCMENNCPNGVLVPVTIEPAPPTHGNFLFSTDAGDPIDSGTGELYLQEEPLLDIGGLEFALYYGSSLETLAPAANVGTNWRHVFDWKLELVDVNVEITSPDGRLIRFEKGYFGTEWELVLYDDVAFQLVQSGSDYVLGDPRDQRMHTFGSNGRLKKIEDGRGNVWTLTYTSGRLSQVTDGLGRTLTFAYNGAGRLTSASDGTRTATLAYSGANLVSVTDPDGETTTYAYDPAAPSLARMISRTRPEGNVPYT
ncbi:MAG: RHS repeat protein, partial [Actinobacteria bacterium]|nr:RHS repeat protein [Actinomycetota bacterium]